MFRKSFYIIVILHLVVPQAFSTDFTTIQSGAAIGDDAVVSGSGSVSYNFVRIDSLSSRATEEDQLFVASVSENSTGVIQNAVDIDFTFVFDGIKIAYHELSEIHSLSGNWYVRDWQWAYDGEKMELYRLDPIGENDLLVPLGSVRTENKMQLQINDPRYDAMMVRGTPVSEFLQGKIGDHIVDDIQVISTETIDDISCDVITGYDQTTKDTIIVWLSPDIVFRPLRIEISSSNEKTVINNKFKDYGNGIWFPQETTREVYYWEENSDEEILYTRETLTIHDDFEVNIDIPSDAFEIDFPVGMTVYDFRTGESVEITED